MKAKEIIKILQAHPDWDVQIDNQSYADDILGIDFEEHRHGMGTWFINPEDGIEDGAFKCCEEDVQHADISLLYDDNVNPPYNGCSNCGGPHSATDC